MDPMTIVGIVLAILAIVLSTIIDGNSFAPLVGPSSAVLVLFGTLGATIAAYRVKELLTLPKAFIVAVKGSVPDVSTTVTTIAKLADVARRQGILKLEEQVKDLDDAYLKAGIQLVVDGAEAEQVIQLLETENEALSDRHRVAIGATKSMASYSPTFGMIGTVIGLINMLRNLSDPSAIGTGMALALLTTLYGVMFANLIYTPVHTRLLRLHEAELNSRNIVMEGVLAIREGVSPRQLVEQLEAYLPQSARVGVKVRLGQEKPGADKAAKADA